MGFSVNPYIWLTVSTFYDLFENKSPDISVFQTWPKNLKNLHVKSRNFEKMENELQNYHNKLIWRLYMLHEVDR